MGALDTTRAPDWADLVATALLGTDRRTPALPAVGGALGALLGQIDVSADPPGALLGAAAAVALYGRAGWLPPRSLAQPFPPAPPDDLPTCGTTAGQYLSQMLAGKHRAALPEWLAALATTGRAVPPTILQLLLDHGHANKELRPQIVAVIGARGRWLAGLNANWDYAVLGEGETPREELIALWETGTRAVRLAVLIRLRAADSNAARAALAATWASEKVDERAAFLETFASGLSMADEPFLEQVLDDRSERVRKAAAGLLAILPESRLSQRMLARLSPLLRWTPGVGPQLPGGGKIKKPALEVLLPEEYEPTMQRDGIVRK
ncbi:MAG: hypothetical protein HGA65_17335, partial [Oscillochloris sp.]|nr:hypothetical protein [Oscillochloris sp.]